MTQVTLNQNPLKNAVTQDQSLDELVSFIFDKEVSKENILVSINLDGEIIPFEDGLKVATAKVSSFKEIDFEIKSSVELAYEALDSCNDYIDLLVKKIKFLTDCYNKNELDQANHQFTEVIDILDLYTQLFARIHSTLKRNFSGSFTISEDIQKLDIHLLSILKALIPAKEKGDIIMLCDLLEYELIDNLTQWKIKIVPALKKMKGN
ncbi:MAG: hypothetical protein CME60_01855 [Halobacteriovoraceae bacterium]|jgi:hypothetical protein|nr:hypothetical protein [Halobacteriovoraceae bacterium]|tara:strand:- start:733 stop:1353 length:621 start_codon:yes stop_codon:yes gene_type:complete